jgi:hypothetical protein
MTINYEHLNAFCLQVIAADTSVRWAGIVNKNGIILAQQKRAGLQLLLTDEENEDYAGTAIARQKTRSKFEGKIGRMEYAFGSYEKLLRATIPIEGNYFLLITIDVENRGFDSIITKKLLPLIERDRSKFSVMDDSI